jgi:hypothetical protein
MLIVVLIIIRNSSGVRDPMSQSRYQYPKTVDLCSCAACFD